MIFTYYFVPNIGMFLWTVILHIYVYDIYLLFCTWHRNVFLDIPKRIDVSWTFRVCVCLGFKLKQRNWCSSLLVLWLTFPFPIYILVNPNAEWNKRLYEFGGSSVCFFVGASFNVIYIYCLQFSVMWTFDIYFWHFTKLGKQLVQIP